MDTAAARLGAWVSNLNASAIPAPVFAEAKRCIIDTTGVSFAGAKEASARLVRSFATSEYAAGPCTLIGSSARISATGAALANGTCAHVLDFDDTNYAGIVHGSAVVWPAVLAAGQLAAISGEDGLVAFIAGSEAEYALGLAFQDVSYRKGWWNTALFGSIGAAAGAARALGLDPDRTAHAIAIAATQAIGMRSVLGTPAKPYLCGRAAETGVAAALSSRAGLAGPAAAIEHRFGFAALVNDGVCRSDALDRIGRSYALLDPGVAIKLFPVCSAAQAAMEATLEIVTEHGLAADAVERVECEVTPLVHVSLAYDRPSTPAECQFSMPFAIACILLFRKLGPEMIDGSLLGDPRLAEAMPKVSMKRSDTIFSASPQEKRDCPEGAIVTVVTRDGRRISREKGAASGMPANRMPDARLHEKFLACATRTLAAEQARPLLERLRGLERHGPIRSLLGG